jgi:hypothetical protein
MTDQITRRDFDKLLKKITAIEQANAISDLVNESEAAKLLACSIRTIQNKVYSGDIPQDAYNTGVAGKRFYKKSWLMGIKKIA